MKESSKKKLVSSSWVGHVKKNCRLKTGKKSRSPESGREMMARKTDIAMGDCIINDLERVGEEYKK